MGLSARRGGRRSLPSERLRAWRRAGGRWLNAGALGLAMGCGAASEGPRQPLQGPRMPEPKPASLSPGFDAELQRAAAEVARLRRLDVLAEIRSERLPRAALAERVREQLLGDTPKPWIEGQTRLLRLLGLVPEDFDYVAAFVSLLEHQLAGFYDPTEKTMFVASDLPGLGEQETVVHELVHALQDQHFRLGAELEARLGASDALTALHLLAEGDAMSVTLEAQLTAQGLTLDRLDERLVVEHLRGSLEELHPELPGIVKRAAVAPYADGFAFVQALRREGDWGRVDEVWKRPPRSTEQALHPAKYLKDEGWRSLAPLGNGPWSTCRLVHTDMLGEQAVGLVLAEWLPSDAARTASAGWDGDQASIFDCGANGEGLVWRLAYDDAQSREVAFATLAQLWTNCPDDAGGARGVRRIGEELVVVALGGSGASCGSLSGWFAALSAE